MRRVLLVRHAESELSARRIVNGDPDVACPLTPTGHAQARDLQRTLAHEQIDLAVTTDFERCRQTAAIALGARAVPRIELPELGDIRAGQFEARPIEAYLRWAHTANATDPAPGGGESRVDAARRFATGLRVLQARGEDTALVVAHQLTLAFVLAAAAGTGPPRKIEPVAHAQVVELTAPQILHAAETLDSWARAPDW